MQRIEKTVDVNAPLRAVYNQWTQFEDFPRFMPGVTAVRQTDDTHVRWSARFWSGIDEEWDAEITEQEPDKRISWKSVSGTPNSGTVRFEPLDDSHTRVRLVMAYQPQGFVENAGDMIGLVEGKVQQAMRGFKDFIEERRTETGAWRGEVHDSTPQPRR